jgi:hypothetical protein
MDTLEVADQTAVWLMWLLQPPVFCTFLHFTCILHLNFSMSTVRVGLYFTKFLEGWQWCVTPHLAHMPCHLFYAKHHTQEVNIPAPYHEVWLYCDIPNQLSGWTNWNFCKIPVCIHVGMLAMDFGEHIKLNWRIPFAFYSPLLLQKEMWLELFQPECNTQQPGHWCNDPMKFILTKAFY